MKANTNIVGKEELIKRIVESVKADRELSKQLKKEDWQRFLASARIVIRAAEEHFLRIIKEALNKGEEIVIKDFFTIKRQIPKAKGSKRCDKHEKEIETFRRANKGKGIQAYAKSETFKKLTRDIRKCNSCKLKKQQIAKTAKPTTRITLRTSKNFWVVTKKSVGKGR